MILNKTCPYCDSADSVPVMAKKDWDESKPYFSSTHVLHKCSSCGLYYCRNLEQAVRDGLARYFAESYNLSRGIDAEQQVRDIWGRDEPQSLSKRLKSFLRRQPLWVVFRDKVLKRPRQFGDDRGGQVLSILHNNGLHSLLDVGCSYGGFVELARRSNVKAYGVEPTEEIVTMIKSFGIRGIEAGFFPQCHGPLERYDAITMFHVLMHFAAPDKSIFTAISERLNHGGKFIIFCLDPDFPDRKSQEASLAAPHAMSYIGRDFTSRAARENGFSSYEYLPCPSEPGTCFHILTR